MSKSFPEVTIKTGEEIYENIDECFSRHCSSCYNMREYEVSSYEAEDKQIRAEKWIKLSDLKKLLDELNPDEVSEAVHDFIMENFKPKRGGWAKDISPLVWKFWNKILEIFE